MLEPSLVQEEMIHLQRHFRVSVIRVLLPDSYPSARLHVCFQWLIPCPGQARHGRAPTS